MRPWPGSAADARTSGSSPGYAAAPQRLDQPAVEVVRLEDPVPPSNSALRRRPQPRPPLRSCPWRGAWVRPRRSERGPPLALLALGCVAGYLWAEPELVERLALAEVDRLSGETSSVVEATPSVPPNHLRFRRRRVRRAADWRQCLTSEDCPPTEIADAIRPVHSRDWAVRGDGDPTPRGDLCPAPAVRSGRGRTGESLTVLPSSTWPRATAWVVIVVRGRGGPHARRVSAPPTGPRGRECSLSRQPG